MSYKRSKVFEDLLDKTDSDEDFLFYNQGKVFSLLERYPCALVPMSNPEYTEEENDKLNTFISSVYQQQGLTTTYLHGTAIDPKRLLQNEAPYKQSKFLPTEFLLVNDEYGEDTTGRELLLYSAKVAAVCNLPWLSFTGGTFKGEVLTTIIESKEKYTVPLLQVILQNRINQSCAKMSVPFFIDVCDITIRPDRTFYKFTSENEAHCYSKGNHLIRDWRNMN